MTSNENGTEYVSGHEIKLTLLLTPEQAAGMQAWSDSIPTLYMLDICVANVTKLSQAALDANARKAALVERLRHLDKPQNSFSYLLALIEKASGPKAGLTDEELEAQILHDVTKMRKFFVHAKILEADEFLLGFARVLRHEPPELARDAYLEFLRRANALGLANPVARADRLQMAHTILALADSLSITRQHSTVLLTLACLYGNVAARKVMKFRADPCSFRAENALADIMVISRFIPLKLQVEQETRDRGRGFMRLFFLTDDTGLTEVLSCFKGQKVRSTEQDASHETMLNVKVELATLLTEINMDKDTPSHADSTQETGQCEFDRLSAMLFENAKDQP